MLSVLCRYLSILIRQLAEHGIFQFFNMDKTWTAIMVWYKKQHLEVYPVQTGQVTS